MANESLYPTILFHFTSRESLYRILDETFKVSYSREIVLGPTTTREFAVPMVSFCDLRLSELKNHIDNYGNYGMGLSKSWANRKGLNPVMYVNRSCQLADNFNNGLSGIYNHLNRLDNPTKIEDLSKYYLNILKTYQYLKNYEGHLKRNNVVEDKNFRFADEREWRYVPKLNKTGSQPFIAISNIDTKRKRNITARSVIFHYPFSLKISNI